MTTKGVCYEILPHATKTTPGSGSASLWEKTVPALPPSLLYKYFRLKRIKLNKNAGQPQDRLQEGDLVELYINDEFFGEGRQDLAFLKVPDKLTIIYEDENILLVDKKPGLVVHEDDDNTPDTLINRILHYLYNKGEYNPQAEQSFIPALCNRIDRNTGALSSPPRTRRPCAS